ncbi:hypothetical protein N0B40_13300 [Chryseobacterium oranimense]|uniref:hypothetical protein n=1 Tax=Chryseobacterium oranimense TaxID=421058 RepID=UPI0021AEB91E|nr:hypothetical protein [Chryseobacterium oranimense]UWX59384.1 hypothetical protein N0B40_13300 [Chryseobacterium oranimense]
MGTLEIKKTEYHTQAVGNRLKGLVWRNKEVETNPMIEAHVEHDIGVMFMFKAKDSILRDCFGSAPKTSRPYLDSYLVDISIFEILYNKYSSQGKGIKFEFVFITDKEYIDYTGNTDISTAATEFLYFIATPIDNNDDPINEHYIIFNLNHRFEIGKDYIGDESLDRLRNRYLSKDIFNNMITYSTPVKPTEHIYYSWADINNILIERNGSSKLYKEVEFSFGEVIEYDIIVDYFKKYSYYKFDAAKYKSAYGDHERKLTILGRYMPDDMSGSEGYFDMGSLYP